MSYLEVGLLIYSGFSIPLIGMLWYTVQWYRNQSLFLDEEAANIVNQALQDAENLINHERTSDSASTT